MAEVARRLTPRPRPWWGVALGFAVVGGGMTFASDEAEHVPAAAVTSSPDSSEARDAATAAGLANEEQRFDDAIDLAERALEAAAAAHDSATELEARLTLAYALGVGQHETEEALLVLRNAEANVVRLGDRLEDRAALLRARANVLHTAGHNALAIVDMRAAIHLLDASGTDTAVRMWQGLGSMQARLGDDEGSLRSHDIAVEKAAKELGTDHPDYAAILVSRARTLRNLGRVDDAVAAFVDGIARLEAHYGRDHRKLAIPLLNHGIVLRDGGDFEAADEVLTRYRAIVSRRFTPDDAEHARAAITLAETRLVAGKIAEGLQAATEATVLAETLLGPLHRRTAYAYDLAGQALAATGDLEAGRVKVERALTIAEAAFGPDHPQLVHYLGVAAEAAGRLGDRDTAKQHIARARSIAERRVVRPDLVKLLDNVEGELEPPA